MNIFVTFCYICNIFSLLSGAKQPNEATQRSNPTRQPNEATQRGNQTIKPTEATQRGNPANWRQMLNLS